MLFDSYGPLRRVSGLLLMVFTSTALADADFIDPPPPRAESSPESSQSSSPGRDYLYNFVRIPARATAEVFRTDREGLKRNAIAIGSVGLAFAMDQEIRDWSQDNRSNASNRITTPLYDIGTPRTAAIGLVGGYSYAFLADDGYFAQTLHLSFQSLLVSQMFTTVFKKGFQRTRPRDSPDDPFDQSAGSESFFSGHASGTWATLTVLAKRYPHQRAVGWGAYTIAGAVALSRVHDDGHWASDVLAGSLVGYGIGHLTVEMSPFRNHDAVVLPIIDQEMQGVMIAVRF